MFQRTKQKFISSKILIHENKYFRQNNMFCTNLPVYPLFTFSEDNFRMDNIFFYIKIFLKKRNMQRSTIPVLFNISAWELLLSSPQTFYDQFLIWTQLQTIDHNILVIMKGSCPLLCFEPSSAVSRVMESAADIRLQARI